MIVFGKAWQYSVHGRKADELLEYIRENIEFTHLEEGESMDAVKLELNRKIDELNRKYPKTVKYSLYVSGGYIRISPKPGGMSGLSIAVLQVRPIRKEVQHG